MNQAAASNWSRPNPPRSWRTARKAVCGSSAWRWGLADEQGQAVGEGDDGDRVSDAESFPGEEI